MRTAVYCVSKNGYETCLKIRNNVYKMSECQFY